MVSRTVLAMEEENNCCSQHQARNAKNERIERKVLTNYAFPDHDARNARVRELNERY